MFQSGKFTENLGIVTSEHCKLLFYWVFAQCMKKSWGVEPVNSLHHTILCVLQLYTLSQFWCCGISV